MAGNASNYLEVEMRKHIFRTGSFTKPTALYVALHTADPTDAATGAEVSGGSYARQALAPLDANWSAPDGTGGVTRNQSVLTYPAPTANWGTVTHFSIWDALTGGNMLIHAPLGTARVINSGDPAPLFPVDTIVVTFL
jgi:hypothetical protein